MFTSARFTRLVKRWQWETLGNVFWEGFHKPRQEGSQKPKDMPRQFAVRSSLLDPPQACRCCPTESPALSCLAARLVSWPAEGSLCPRKGLREPISCSSWIQKGPLSPSPWRQGQRGLGTDSAQACSSLMQDAECAERSRKEEGSFCKGSFARSAATGEQGLLPPGKGRRKEHPPCDWPLGGCCRHPGLSRCCLIQRCLVG